MRPAASPRGYPEALVENLLDGFALRRRRRPLLVGLSGTQASGKSTLAAQLARAARRRGHETLVLALDDYYLGREERRVLAQRVHPLLATRGVPGTHHVAALREALVACRDGRAQGLAVDTGADDGTRVEITRGLGDGDTVRVFNALGAVVCALAVTDEVRPGVVSLPKGLWQRHTKNGATATALAPDSLADLGGGACFNDARVEVERSAG